MFNTTFRLDNPQSGLRDQHWSGTKKLQQTKPDILSYYVENVK